MLWRATQSDAGKKMMSIMGKGMEMATKGLNAPGAQQMREAGCPQALVMDVGDMLDGFGELFDAGVPKKEKEMFAGQLALCQGTAFDQLPDCDTLAAVYVKAVH